MGQGQWIVSSDGQRWYFDPGSLALDFGYTGAFGFDHPEWEQLHGPADLDQWLHKRFGDVADTTARDFASALTLRSAVWDLTNAAVIGHPASQDAIDAVNSAAAQTPPRPFLQGGTLDTPRTTVTHVMSVVAADIIDVLTVGSGRLRRCAADDCQLIFFDRSRPNARRWCSMDRCGNRSKMRHRRSSKPPDTPKGHNLCP